mgnify:CR=1 FL=1
MADETRCGRLVVVLGDQLDAGAVESLVEDPARDRVWMAEVSEESEHIRSSKARTSLFLAAMRHFRQELEARRFALTYHRLEENPHRSLARTLAADLGKLRPSQVVLTRPGEWRVRDSVLRACQTAGVPLDIRPDKHFLCPLDEFEAWAANRKQLRLEHFYRHMRKRNAILLDGGMPAGGRWNFDAENRKSFGRKGPGTVPAPAGFEPDGTTADVLRLVDTKLVSHPGRTDGFCWPVTRSDSLAALDDFIEHRLAGFGRWQDAMWSDEPWLWHSTLSASLNLKLLNPREVIDRAVQAWSDGLAPIASVEGFVRQILGWREYVRGMYWHLMPGYLDMNALDAHVDLPGFYWTAETEMFCLRSVILQTLNHGYAHHIQRLMVTGLFALLLGVEPRQIHEWYLAVYVDAVEWVELPNVMGMSQYADGGIVASKPYAASGRYIQRMSDYCRQCRYDPVRRHGDDACPITTLYWDFLMRHRRLFANQPRTANQWRHLERMTLSEQDSIRNAAARVREVSA